MDFLMTSIFVALAISFGFCVLFVFPKWIYYWIKKEPITNEQNKKEALRKKYTSIYPKDDVQIERPIKNDGQWEIFISKGFFSSPYLEHRVMFNPKDFNKFIREETHSVNEGDNLESKLLSRNCWDEDGNEIEE